MKKREMNGFVLAETLVVTVFLMTIFTMLYRYFYPLIGEYEKREVYDDVDGKYSLYWLKRIIEDSGYKVTLTDPKGQNFTKYGYFRFECDDVPVTDEKRQMCKTLVNALQVEGCTANGNDCNIFISRYQIGKNKEGVVNFKDSVKANTVMRYQEDCFKDDSTCKSEYINRCISEKIYEEEECNERASEKVFNGGFQDYVELLPNFKSEKQAYRDHANYRIVASFQHRTDNNNYHSYATMEVEG